MDEFLAQLPQIPRAQPWHKIRLLEFQLVQGSRGIDYGLAPAAFAMSATVANVTPPGFRVKEANVLNRESI